MDKQRIIHLCSLDGVSGKEETVRNYILEELHTSNTPKDITVDKMGNILVHLHGMSPAKKKVLFDAHMDEVGFIITHINGDGTLCFDTVGGIDKRVLVGQIVRIGTVHGVIGLKAVHQCSGDEKNTLPSDLTIDIGAEDRTAAEKIITIGQCGTFAREIKEWNDGFVTGKALDDRVGCALLLSLADKRPAHDIWLSFSVQEEVGLRGAKVVGETVQPDIAIAIDVTTAADGAGSSDKTCVCRVGNGPVVSFMDKATLYDQELYQTIRSMADEEGIPTQTKNRIAGGNNAGALQRSHLGVRIAAISLPCRYIHSPSCVANFTDIERMEELLTLLSERLPV